MSINGSEILMASLFGVLLGAALATYPVLSTSSLGYAFPAINGDISARPTFGRIFKFFIGRCLGFLALAMICGAISVFLKMAWLQRLFLVALIFLAIFLILYAFTNDSPELFLAQKSDITGKSFPLIVLGFLSTFILVAPNIIAIFLVFSKFNLQTSYIFFTNLFLGHMLFFLPVLLNKTWSKSQFYYYFSRVILVGSGSVVLVFSVKNLLLK